MGCGASTVAPSAEAPSASSWTLVGDCLGVRRQGNDWVRGYVVATAESDAQGSLLLMLLEGYGETEWLWVNRKNDLDRLAPLVTNSPESLPPGLGPKGKETQKRFRDAVTAARRRLVGGDPFQAPRCDAPALFQSFGKCVEVDLGMDPQEWLAAQKRIERAPFLNSTQHARFQHSCLAMWESAVTGIRPPDPNSEAPMNLTASGLMISPNGEYVFLVENPSVHPPSPGPKGHVLVEDPPPAGPGTPEGRDASPGGTAFRRNSQGAPVMSDGSHDSSGRPRLSSVLEERPSVVDFSSRASSAAPTTREAPATPPPAMGAPQEPQEKNKAAAAVAVPPVVEAAEDAVAAAVGAPGPEAPAQSSSAEDLDVIAQNVGAAVASAAVAKAMLTVTPVMSPAVAEDMDLVAENVGREVASAAVAAAIRTAELD